MEKQLANLIGLIRKEVNSLENFLQLLTEEEACLVNKRFDLLKESIRKKEQIIIQAKKLEENRRELTSWFYRELKIDQGKTTLSKLAQLLDSSHSSKLKELQNTLLELHRKVDIQRKNNEELIKKSMGYIDRDIRFLIDSSPTPYFKNSLNNQGKANPSLILDKLR